MVTLWEACGERGSAITVSSNNWTFTTRRNSCISNSREVIPLLLTRYLGSSDNGNHYFLSEKEGIIFLPIATPATLSFTIPRGPRLGRLPYMERP